ncbi:MAG: PLP-dependent aminotransferase family protein [Parafilimonas terrae]|nr:PLP-dependent aminotransferase family protein [Parafilimonas terrae]
MTAGEQKPDQPGGDGVPWEAAVGAISGPRYRAIVQAVEIAIEAGRLRPGDRLPPQRELARRLGVNLGTVGQAYATMQESGLVSGEVGRGTFITAPERADGPRSLWDHTAPATFVDLSHNFPDRAPLHPAVADIVREAAAAMDLGPLLARQIDAGLPVHRQAASAWLGRFGLHRSADDMMITCGGQHGLALAMAALTQPGDSVLTEELTFYGLRSAAGVMGRTLLGVRMDRHGLMPEYLDLACRRTGTKVLFCTPTLHNPTTATMPAERRREILAVARTHDLMIVEDDVWGFMPEVPELPFAALDPERAVYVTSLSKIVGPGLRIGMICMPRHAAHALGVALRATTLMASPMTAEWAARLVASPIMNGVIGSMRREIAARQSIVAACLPERSLITRPDSFNVWMKLTNGWSSEAFTRAAEAAGVGVTPCSMFEVGIRNRSDAVRICLNGAPDQAALTWALHRLSATLTRPSLESMGGHTPRRLVR